MSKNTLAWVSSACAFLAFSAVAFAQSVSSVECRKTETQAECHARLKCKPTEELEDCQKRLLKCTGDESLDDCKKRVNAANAGQRDDANQNRDDERSGRDRQDERSGRDREDDRSGRDGDDDNDRGRDRDDEQSGRERRGRDSDDGDRGRRDGGRRSRGQRGGGGGGGGFEANKTFGLGLELGEPTGLNGKLFVSDTGALDFGIGAIYRHYYYGDGLHLYLDYLFHPVVLAHAAAFELPLYIGPGIRFWDFDYCDNNICTYGGSAIGIRVPVGIAFDFNNVPLDIFIQLVPVVDFLRGDYYDRYRDRTHFGVDFSVGIRYWFK